MKFNIYKHLEYREIIRSRAKNVGLTFKSLADFALTHTSYFSRVLAGGANFSQEQGYLIAQALEFSVEETDFFLLLIEFESSSNSHHRQSSHVFGTEKIPEFSPPIS
jgi:hypothetical protein